MYIRPAPPDPNSCGVTVIIKTLNEEASIARAIKSALDVTAELGGEVIVADGGSTDRTVAEARRYPVRVVQLADPAERCCGIGPQLGYQQSRFDFVYVMDGDMELKLPFIRIAVDLLLRDKTIAGVGGRVVEQRTNNIEFKSRERHAKSRAVPNGSPVECLTGGGLYRREAINSAQYLSDRNLHGFEEFDLGARLRINGWRLVRIDCPAVDHYSHSVGTYTLLWARLRAGRLLAHGEILRSAAASGYVTEALTGLHSLRFALAMLIYWPIVALLAFTVPSHAVALSLCAFAVPVLAMSLRSKSIASGLYSVIVWNLSTLTMLAGIVRPRKDPVEPIAFVELHQPFEPASLAQMKR